MQEQDCKLIEKYHNLSKNKGYHRMIYLQKAQINHQQMRLTLPVAESQGTLHEYVCKNDQIH